MLAMLGSLEPMCQKELLLEGGATLEDELDRQEIYRNHREAPQAHTRARWPSSLLW